MCLPNGIIYINSNSPRLLSYSADKKRAIKSHMRAGTKVKKKAEECMHILRQYPCGSVSMHLSLSHYSQ